LTIFSIVFLVGIPLTLLEYQSDKTGKTWSQIFEKFIGANEENINNKKFSKGEKIDFLVPRSIGDEYKQPPQISHLQPVDLDKDDLLDVIVCDVLDNKISWIRQSPLGVFSEHFFGRKFNRTQSYSNN